MECAYFLVAHGSPNPDYLAHLHHFVAQVVAALDSNAPVGVGTLAGSLALTETLPVFIHKHRPAAVRILPLLLGAGVHTRSDIPAAVAQVQTALDQGTALEVLPHLGHWPSLGALLRGLVPPDISTWVGVVHGSRQPDAYLPLEQAISPWGGHLATWTQTPTLAECLQHLASASDSIAIVPCFLCPGPITRALQTAVPQLARQCGGDSATIQLHLTPPLGASPALVPFVVDCLRLPPIYV
ncbi:MAG: hypothetical protein IGQ88_04730 [Gloeomargaritaceae cyanobacterium C42_A2020_066]|nr:hypothetical protein [Gloeomargaritaceae cyanobacterium C42_A2020_066]